MRGMGSSQAYLENVGGCRVVLPELVEGDAAIKGGLRSCGRVSKQS
jgi:hypothetical protein